MKLPQILQIIQRANKNYLAFGAFALLVFLFYGNTLLNDFVLDDVVVIEHNPQVHSLEHIEKAVTGCQWGASNQGCHGRTIYYRPAPFLASILAYQISPLPWIFHFVSLLYFFIAVSLIFLLTKILTRNFVISTLAALVFLIHPINSEAVNSISSFADLLLGIFVLLAALFYARFRESENQRDLWFVYVSYFFAMLSKESGAFFPLIVPVMDMFLFRMPLKSLFTIKQIRVYALFIIPAALYFAMRIGVIGVVLGGGFIHFTASERIFASVTSFAQYIGKLFAPYPLSVFHVFEKGSSITSSLFVIFLIVCAAFAAAIIVLLRKRQHFLAFSFLWFFIFLSPALIFIEAIGEKIVTERYLFVPMVGFSMAIAYGIVFLSRAYPRYCSKTPQRFVWICLVIAVGAASWFVVYQRNREWRDNEIISLKTLEQNPSAHAVRTQLAYWYVMENEPEKAKQQFEELIVRAQGWSDITMAYKGLGDYYRAKGDQEKALESYLKATETGHAPRDYVTYNDVGVLYMEKEKYLNGFAYFCQSLQLFSDTATMDNMNVALSFIDTEYVQQDKLLQATREQLEKAKVENISFRDTRCDEESCQYAFSVAGSDIEVIPPFLISASTANKKNGETKDLEIQNRGYDPAQGVILLEMNKTYEKNSLVFLFPTCRGWYYEAMST